MQPAPRPAAAKAGAKGKEASVPDPTKQQDRHTQLAALLLRAEAAPDPLERLLAVERAILCLLCDLLRPGTTYQQTPAALLGQHYLSRRQLAEKHRGDAVLLHLEELCSHEPLGPTWHAKYGSRASSLPLASLALQLRPAVAVRQAAPRGLLGGSATAWAECALEGQGTISFERHAEQYAFSLPALVLTDPLAEACQLDFGGTATLTCETTGLSSELRFKPFRGGYVKGGVARLLGDGSQPVASLSGSWSGRVEVDCPELGATGVLFDAAQHQPPAELSINLSQPGPRGMARLWAALLEGLACVDRQAAGKEGKKAEALAAELPQHLRGCLQHEPPTEPPSGPQAGPTDQPGTAAVAGTAAVVPPCVLAQHAKHGTPTYQMHYRLQALA